MLLVMSTKDWILNKSFNIFTFYPPLYILTMCFKRRDRKFKLEAIKHLSNSLHCFDESELTFNVSSMLSLSVY